MNGEELRASAAELRIAVAGDAGAAAYANLEALVDELATVLGPSPEAWRGAAVTAAMIGSALGQYRLEDVDPRAAADTVLGFAVLVAAHPDAIAALEEDER